MSLPDSTPQRHAAAIPGIKLPDLNIEKKSQFLNVRTGGEYSKSLCSKGLKLYAMC
jgi:hypothetical protein